jgi:formimidoylglutamate deiminase
MAMEQLLWAPAAWLGGRWQQAVVLRSDAQGRWAEVEAGCAAPPESTLLPGPVLPGLVNAHSHAFQRAFAGLAERRTGSSDDFWSWRERMYGVAQRITSAQLHAVAAQLYAELLAGGYTQVCEFHYLHHRPDGTPGDDPLAMCHALVRAAADTGIGLTLLPALYERAGFAAPALRQEQRRFAAGPEAVLALRDGVRALGAAQVNAGVAVHSLRAAPAPSLRRLLRQVAQDAGPIHLHIAEQAAEVADCLAATGARPIEWLAREVALDARWQLVHATHATPQEIEAVATSGAGVVLCPSTEANLGDGLPDLQRWLASAAPLALGSDSQVGRCWAEELRWLDYGQRLALQRRNVAADPSQHAGATAANLFERMLAGGAAAAGLRPWGLVRGARADLLVLDTAASGLLGVPPSHWLDALVFATTAPALRQVWVAGRCVLGGGGDGLEHASRAAAFASAMAGLWLESA